MSLLRRLGRFVNRTWPWLPAALLVLAIARAAVSIATEAPEDAVTQINHAVHGYARAAVAGRGTDACHRLSPRARRQIEAAVGGEVPCSVILRSYGAPLSAAALQNVVLARVVVHGNSASVAPQDVLTGNRKPTNIALGFQKVSGSWKLDSVRRAPALARRPGAAAARP